MPLQGVLMQPTLKWHYAPRFTEHGGHNAVDKASESKHKNSAGCFAKVDTKLKPRQTHGMWRSAQNCCKDQLT